MSVEFSRRQSLKMIGAAGILSIMPLDAVSAGDSNHAFIIFSKENEMDVFTQTINKSIDTSTIQVNLKSYESFLSISDLPKGTLLIGLVNEAEKVLIDAIVQNRSGIINTTARVNAMNTENSIALIPEIADSTVNSALSFSSDHNFDEVQNSELSSGSLISFYAYL
ncbi:MAG: hypothetical protein P8J61_04130 [Gammaproteobacteria bacterium]|jgi:hypothetical protein|nr:hypothetical protein [Gammaproteobacteria bacterium]